MRALLSHIRGPQVYPGVVNVRSPWTSNPPGPCLVLRLIHDLAHGRESPKRRPGWQAQAVAVLADLVEAGFGPSIYPGEKCCAFTRLQLLTLLVGNRVGTVSACMGSQWRAVHFLGPSPPRRPPHLMRSSDAAGVCQQKSWIGWHSLSVKCTVGRHS